MNSIDNIEITLSDKFKPNIHTSIIPILTSRLKTASLYLELNNYIPISPKYKSLIDDIENSIKNKKLAGASITIELEDKCITNTTKSKTLKSTHSSKDKSTHTMKTTQKQRPSNFHQIYMVVLSDSYKTYKPDKPDNKNNKKPSNSSLLENARLTGNSVFQIMKINKLPEVNLIDTVCEPSFISSIMEGLLLSSYKFLKYKTAQSLNKDRFAIKHINIASTSCKNISTSAIDHKLKVINNLKTEVECVFLARDLINEPANLNKSDVFINVIKSYIKKHKLPITVQILSKSDLEKLKMGLILGVGQGSNSENEPKLVLLKYNGTKPDCVLLGKGITFDTGGLDLKPPRSMIEMKTDLSGAATVMSFLLGYAKMKGSRCIYTICPFAENSIGPDSIKPSDVLTAYNGKTVEVTNTDAEGRLVLADSLAYIVEKYPKAMIIDFATLTGQQESISGKMFSNILAVNSVQEVAKLKQVGILINEPLVELPMMESKFLPKLESAIADIKNVSTSSSADMILSTVFMRQFINKSTKWVHIDIAGPSYQLGDNVKYMGGEASGIGVRLLFEFFTT